MVMPGVPEFMRFEILVAEALEAEIAPSQNPGYDVYNSRRYPGQTFQVKVSNAGKPIKYIRFGKSYRRAAMWTWQAASALHVADWYVLFGVYEEVISCFLLSKDGWLDHSIKTTGRTKNGARHLTCPITKFRTFKGGNTRTNYMQHYEIRDWPDSLYRKIDAYQDVLQLRFLVEPA